MITTINADRIVRRKDFLDPHVANRLAVSSVFRTIQGEGPFAGRVAVFLRLAGCNFGDKQDHCDFCDTAFQLDNATWISLEAVRTILLSQMGYDPKDILVVTGGEPTLQNNLLPFLELVKGDFSEIQIETNGTQAYFFDEVPSNVYTVVSPKASKKIHGYAPLSPRVMEKASCLKFVLSADPESAHHTVPDWAMAHKQVYVSPMAVYARPYEGEVSSIWVDGLFNKEETAANYAYAAQYAMKHNLILSLQTHLFTNIP